MTDDCGVSANDVTAQAFQLQNNFDLGPVMFNAMQVNATTVSVSGSVLVSNLMSSPAVVTILVTAIDGCGAFGSDSVQVQVSDTTPPEISVDVTPASLWPPNHKLRDISALVSVMDNLVANSRRKSSPKPGSNGVLTHLSSGGHGLGGAGHAIAVGASTAMKRPGTSFRTAPGAASRERIWALYVAPPPENPSLFTVSLL